jgi:hypothetical protein
VKGVGCLGDAFGIFGVCCPAAFDTCYGDLRRRDLCLRFSIAERNHRMSSTYFYESHSQEV